MTIHWVGIGEIKLARRGEKLGAVLGSCASIVLWHPGKRTALMNHVLLPSRQIVRDDDSPGRYADESWPLMRKALAGERIALQDCICHVVGGGKVLQPAMKGDIGRDNVAMIFDLLFHHGVWIESMDVGASGYRVVKFDVDSGELIVSRRRTLPARATGQGCFDQSCCCETEGGRA